MDDMRRLRLTQTTRLERTETTEARNGPAHDGHVSPKRLDLRELKPGCSHVLRSQPERLTQTTRLERTETIDRIRRFSIAQNGVSPKRLDLRELKLHKQQFASLRRIVSPKRLDLRELKRLYEMSTPEGFMSHPNDST